VHHNIPRKERLSESFKFLLFHADAVRNPQTCRATDEEIDAEAVKWFKHAKDRSDGKARRLQFPKERRY
jgi:hypothetical protein